MAQSEINVNGELTSLIDTIQIGQGYTIIVSTLGCYQESTDSIQIESTESGIIIKHGKTVKNLNGESLKTYSIFEHTLIKDDFDGGCTTSKTYILSMNSLNLIIANDNSCSWLGFKRLLDDLLLPT